MVASQDGRKCCVHLLDGRTLDIPLQPKLLSSDLLDIVISHFQLKEKEYFGLLYSNVRDHQCWLRLDKKALDHDFAKTNPINLYFRVKHYIESIAILRDSVTVELFYLQAKALVFKGELECESETVFQLAAYVLQATHGDYVSDGIALKDLKELDVIPVRTLQEHPTLSFCEEKILVYYHNLDGVTKGEAIVMYLNIVEQLPMYGVHYYNVKTKDKAHIPWKLGLSQNGIAQYDFQDKINPRKVFSWTQMENLLYRDKKFSIEYRENGRPGGTNATSTNVSTNGGGFSRLSNFRKSVNQRIRIFSWTANSNAECREIWLMAISLHQFYLDKKPARKLSLTSRSLKDVARNLSKSSASLSSVYSSGSGYNYDNISDTTSFYFSLDGDSVTSSQMMAAEQDMVSALRARRAFLEQLLVEKRELLNEICLQEADLTGVVPEELPESPTHPGKPMRRKVGTTFEFDESLLSVYHDMEGREFERMERDLEIQKQIASAAHRLAMDPSVKKKVRKQRQMSYQKSLVRLKTMEQELEYMKREAVKATSEGLLRLASKEEGDSNGDSLGPIDADTSSEKSHESSNDILRFPNGARIPRRNRDSLYLARPVMTTFDIPVTTMNNLRDKQLTPQTLSSSIIAPTIDLNAENDYTVGANPDEMNPIAQRRTYSIQSRTFDKPPSPPLFRVRAKLHSSADQLNKISSPRSDDGIHLHDNDELTGLYNVDYAKKVDYGSNPSLHSISSPIIVQTANKQINSSSPRTLRKLQQLSLSPSRGYLLPNRFAQSTSQLSQGSSSQSEDWSDIISEETLV